MGPPTCAPASGVRACARERERTRKRTRAQRAYRRARARGPARGPRSGSPPNPPLIVNTKPQREQTAGGGGEKKSATKVLNDRVRSQAGILDAFPLISRSCMAEMMELRPRSAWSNGLDGLKLRPRSSDPSLSPRLCKSVTRRSLQGGLRVVGFFLTPRSERP